MNTTLWPLAVVAIALLLVALAGLLWPLLREPREAPADARQRLCELYRRKQAELAQEPLAADDRQQASDELQLALLRDLEALPQAAPHDRARHKYLPAALLSLALPSAAVALYLHTGDPRAVAELALAAPRMHAGGGDNVETAVARLAARLGAEPDDLEGWVVLARSQDAMERFGDAAKSYRQALTVAERQQLPGPLRARLHADLADVLASARQGALDGPVRDAISAALALDADQPKALALAGAAALRDQDVSAARVHWQRLLGLLQPGSAMALRVEADLQRLADSAPVTRTALRARITVDAGLIDKVPPQATVFVVARPEGERKPLAVLRLRASDLPADVIVDDRHAMSPDRPLARFAAVTLQARLSSTGQAAPQPGDWASDELRTSPAEPGVVLVLRRTEP